MKNHQLKFYYLKYSVAEIRNMITLCPQINNFVFAFYSEDPDSYLQLIAFARVGSDSGDQQYSKLTHTLKPYRGQALEIDGPVIMSNNYIPITEMEGLINAVDPTNAPDYLVFTPGLNSQNHIYYSVAGFKKSDDLDTAVLGDGGYTETNPSPPATMAI
jgi:hypothetical protein